jgi:cell wall-associated protease
LTLTSLTANRTAPQPAGTTITFTATASGGTAPYQFKWWLWVGTGWWVVRDWGAGNTYTWTPTVANAQHQVTVWARSAGQTANVAEAYRGPLPFAITP